MGMIEQAEWQAMLVKMWEESKGNTCANHLGGMIFCERAPGHVGDHQATRRLGKPIAVTMWKDQNEAVSFPTQPSTTTEECTCRDDHASWCPNA